jgi:hypothetical protein
MPGSGSGPGTAVVPRGFDILAALMRFGGM